MKPTLENVDLLRRIVDEARSLKTEEPFLSHVLASILDARPELPSILAQVLTVALRDETTPKSEMQSLLHEVLDQSTALIDTMHHDVAAVLERDPASQSELQVFLNQNGFHALEVYRIGNVLWQDGRRALALHLQSISTRAFGVNIHPACQIGSGAMLSHASGIVIGETSVVGHGATIFQNVTLGRAGDSRGDRHPIVGEHVVLGAGSTLLGPITVGDYARIGAGSVVLQNVPSHTTAVGAPARIIRRCLGYTTIPA